MLLGTSVTLALAVNSFVIQQIVTLLHYAAIKSTHFQIPELFHFTLLH